MKEKLLDALDEARSREAELEALVVDQPANADGTWNAKDHLAHLAWWRRRSADTLNAVRTGSELPPPVDDDDAVTNAIIYGEIKDRPATDTKADAHDSWDVLRSAVEKSSEADLSKPHPRFPQWQVWEVVPGAVGHAGTHIWSWYLDVGDEEHAEPVAKWACELDARFFDTPERLADSRYNLACFYARIGKTDQALPLLRESFEAKSELRDLARRDHDLDRIRDDRELTEMLAS